MSGCNTVIRASTGIVKRVTENAVWYVADGTEGNTLAFDGSHIALVGGVETAINLIGKTVISVNRDNYEQKPTLLLNPTNKEFNWAPSTATLKQANNLDAGEQLKITYI